ncbi:glutathione S-transferase family protein [soil metagenome]
MITVSALRWVPPFAQGLVRDLRVRWALEEAGLPYREKLLGPEDQKSDAYRGLQPFGQVPAYEEEGLALFESGAIVLHIAEKSDALMPPESPGRERTRTWVLAALNTVEPPIVFLNHLQKDTSEGADQRREPIVKLMTARLATLASWLEGKEYLEDRFTAGDLMMTAVLRILRSTDYVKSVPALAAYEARCEARPAFQKALADQLATFERNAPPQPR